MQTEDAVRDIIRLNEYIRDFWGKGAYGWAPPDAAEILSKSRLDWQVSLSKSLPLWCRISSDGAQEGYLILAWANLGVLVEGTMKWFLSVFHGDYARSPVKQKKKLVEPDEMMLGRLSKYFSSSVWTPDQVKQWKPFVEVVRTRRNAIHAYQDRDIGTFDEFYDAVKTYRSFLLAHEGQVPYPDEGDGCPADIQAMRMNEPI